MKTADHNTKAVRNELSRKSAIIKCPTCGNGGKVVDCRASPNGFRRLYMCADNHDWVTLEVRATKFRGTYFPAINEDR